WTLQDGARVESVLLHRRIRANQSGLNPVQLPDLLKESRLTLCVSSQAGCAMNCQFCLTGKQGLTRSLSSKEILDQVDALRAEYAITHVVFMGMGEPLHNFENVVHACQALMKRAHAPISRRKILISTSGWVL